MLVNSFYASYRVQEQMLIDASLEANKVYARKLADSTERHLVDALRQLAYGAGELAGQMENVQKIDEVARRLRLQTKSFNSVAVVDQDGRVLGVSPETLQLLGVQLESEGAVAALKARRPLVSEAYVSAADNLLISLSHPIHDVSGQYRGYVGGTIYLQKGSILHDLLGEHFYRDGSYLYVVGKERRLLYHPEAKRIGTQVGANALLDELPEWGDGARRTVNSQGVDMLAGYAIVPSTGWGIISQRPTRPTLEPLDELVKSVALKTVPLALVTILMIFWLARVISRPLWKLADSAREIGEPDTAKRIEGVRSWYFEAQELKRAMLVGVSLLQEHLGRLTHDVHTDSLTGLSNRRGLERMVDRWEAEKRPFSVLALDIDHFKRVNDTYGHDAGDRVLRRLAELMRLCCRSEDLLCRSGGEEFLILLPGSSQAAAVLIAERLRQLVERTAIEPVGHLTLSIGVAHWPDGDDSIARVFKLADEQLYAAKDGGRNRVAVAQCRAESNRAPSTGTA
ncbi:sensor domain-containing diguanylate cyclase [Pseudomonas sp. RL]|uniref:GGDEF domain-containing protein n=1 Tax=Pseudomonas sp. RL TaxID=1452718 RepID=UPI0009DFB93C|nr:sensor domain-containing diguanylate cyclase [Pseudomonas sp. RL]